VHSDLEMSDFSSHHMVDEENSGCESESDVERRNDKQKTRKKRKTQRDSAAMTSNNRNHSDDETESQLNFEESPVDTYTSPVSLHYQDKMRRRLQFFFMNPVEKWQAKRR
jgi:hypothetical protein